MTVSRSMALAAPLTTNQIEAAGRIRTHLGQWVLSDEALETLRQRLPRFEPSAVLLKVVAINALYGTNVYALVRMADHIGKVLMGADLGQAGPELVEAIAALPVASAVEKPRRHISFASKFAHLFIDAERFPIYDAYSKRVVESHLGRGTTAAPRQPYVSYVADFRRLMDLAGWRGSSRELDRYLWLAGLYREWTKNHDAPIYSEARRLFASPPPDVARDLAALLG